VARFEVSDFKPAVLSTLPGHRPLAARRFKVACELPGLSDPKSLRA